MDIDKIMNIPGVIAVGEFTGEGKIKSSIGEIPGNIMKLAAQMCARNNQLLGTQAREFFKASEMEWFPLVGWCIWAGNYAAIVFGKTGVFVKAKDADLNQLVTLLMQDNPQQPNKDETS